jgi:hypothetical protein
MPLMPLDTFAQQLDLGAPTHEGSRPRPPERDLYPHRSTVPDAPAFLAPLSRQTKTGRAGVAVWMAPYTPVGPHGAGDPEGAGWLGFGFAAEWGGSAKRTGTN